MALFDDKEPDTLKHNGNRIVQGPNSKSSEEVDNMVEVARSIIDGKTDGYVVIAAKGEKTTQGIMRLNHVSHEQVLRSTIKGLGMKPNDVKRFMMEYLINESD
jgi:hypothetical protein